MGGFWHSLWLQIATVAFAAGVVGNLTASLIWALPTMAHLHRKLNRQHAERMAQSARHHRRLLAAMVVDDDEPEPAQAPPPGP